jgi:serine/threonine-protein kinase
MPLRPGDKLGPYEVLALIGAGGMGEVYRARDPRLNRDVAIKVSAAQFSERFEREAKTIAALNHSHICQVYDVGPNYLVMEFIEGDPLKGPLPLEKALEYARQIASALDAAHKKNITHRDLKPANILVTASGVKLLDFGLAKMAAALVPDGETQTMPFTEAGAIMGTAAYMSPEQAKGEEVDARSDIFSFGVVLYELLSGRRAFSRNSSIETMAAILRDEPAPLDAPASVSAIVTRCLRKSPTDRFETIDEVRAALKQATTKPAEKQPSIAVLPFANMSADKENEYFSDGLAEEILNLLAKIPGLKVIARTSSFAFRGKEHDITKIAEALRMENILEGSVRKAGSRVRITAQLIHAADGTHLWSERYDRDMTDVFAIQDEIGQAISEALQVRLAPRATVVNIEAWQLCLKGEFHRLRFTPESLAKAKEYFEQALAIDPNYAHAYNRLALYYYMLGLLGIKPVADMAPLAKAAAAKALIIDPTNSESDIALGVMAAAFDYDWNAAENHFRRAKAAGASARTNYLDALYYLLPLGRVPEAMERSRLALESDPLSMLLHFGMAWCMCCARQYQESIECAQRSLEIDPNYYMSWLTMGLAQVGARRREEAITSIQRVTELAPWWSAGWGYLAAACYLSNDRERSRQLARKLADSHNHTLGAASYYAAAGEKDAMFEALDGAFQERDVFLVYIQSLPFFDPYGADPRFKSLLAKMNLA